MIQYATIEFSYGKQFSARLGSPAVRAFRSFGWLTYSFLGKARTAAAKECGEFLYVAEFNRCVLHRKLLHMAREIRVPAAPDFPRTILKEFQTNVMSADGIHEMATQVPKKIPLITKNSHYLNLIAD